MKATGTATGLFILIFYAALIGGWIANIVQIFDFGAVATWGVIEVLKIVSIFVFPLGSVLGWLSAIF